MNLKGNNNKKKSIIKPEMKNLISDQMFMVMTQNLLMKMHEFVYNISKVDLESEW